MQYVRAVLRRALNQVLKWGYVARNVATLVDVPRVEQYTATILAPLQGQQFLAAAVGHRLEALFTVTLLLGLREGEVLGLRWKDVDFAKYTLRVEQTVQRVQGKLVLGSPKTRGSKRTLPMPTKVEHVLNEYAARQAKERAIREEDWKDHDLVFPSTCGTPLDPRNLLRQFKNVLLKVELANIRFHDLRHSCATVLIAQGVHPRTVMEILGQSQISVTMNIYGHVLPEAQRAAATMMDTVFAEKPSAEAVPPVPPTNQASEDSAQAGEINAPIP